MSAKPNPHKLTIREAYFTFYDRTDLSKASRTSDECYCKKWEKFTDNPPVAEITNQTLTDFKAAMVEAGYKPASVNAVLKFLRKTLRVLAPQQTGNPAGIGLIDRVPYTRPVKDVRPVPKRVPLEDLTAFYSACRHATGPKKWVNPCDWWRALLTMAFFTGLRKGDLFKLQHDQVDLERGELIFSAAKTGKAARYPLHEIACQHLQRIWQPVCPGRRFLFQGFSGGVSLYGQFAKICEAAKLETEFRLHDVRRTSASEIERVAPGLASTFLQHAPQSVTAVSYLNQLPELREAIEKMRVPTGWKPGCKMAERAARDAIEARERIRPVDYLAPVKPDGKFWRFDPGRWSFNGSPWFQMPRRNLQILKLLALSPQPVTIPEILGAVWPGGRPRAKNLNQSIVSRISTIRSTLRKALGLPDSHDPLPCVERGHGGSWTIYFPAELIDGRWNLMGHEAPEPPLQERNSLVHDVASARVPEDFWSINCKTYCYRGTGPYRLQFDQPDLLRLLASASGFVSFYQLSAMFYGGKDDVPTRDLVHKRMRTLRGRLRKDLDLPEDFDPLPYTQGVEGGAWSLQMPTQNWEGGAA